MSAPSTGRLTRKQQQERTRALLLRSAFELVSSHGMHGTSIAAVAEEAGFTKGAFYANFASKDELLMTMLEERFAERLAEIDRAIHADAAVGEQARMAGADFMRALDSDAEWGPLIFEFAVHASRNAAFREQLVARHRAMRERIASLLEERAAELDWTPPIPADVVARMTFAMAHGVVLQKLLEPEQVPEDLYGTMLTTFFAGLEATAADRR
ncbi:MAG: TetR/AcrR family transcriptional regulator [Solirubrobacteraceae bacterium]